MAGSLPTQQQQGIDIGSLVRGLPDLLTLFTGKSSTTTESGGTSTTQTQLSNDTVMGLINQLLGNSQGLASVMQGQNSSGLYNSTVASQMANDLISRVSTEVGAKAAPTTTTKSPTTSTQTLQPQIDPTTALLTAGAVYGGKKLYDVFKNGGGISGIFGSGSEITQGMKNADIINSGKDLSGVIDEFMGSGSSGGGGFTDMVSSLFGSGGGGSDLGGAGSYVSSFMDAANGDWGSALGSAVGTYFGGPIGGMIGNALGDTAISAVGDVASGLGDALGSVVSSVGDIFGGGSVICSELIRQGKFDTRLYDVELKFAESTLNENVINGYRAWATKVVPLMRKSELLSNLLKPIAIAWAQEFAHSVLPHEFKTSYLGKVLRFFGEPICFVIGAIVGKVEYSDLYKKGV